MSAENEQLVRDGYDAFNRRDFDAAMALAPDDEITWRPLFSVETQVLRGKREVMAAWERQIEILDVHVELVELESLDEDRVLAVGRWTGQGSGSGVPIEQIAVQVFLIEDGSLRSVESFPTKREALDYLAR